MKLLTLALIIALAGCAQLMKVQDKSAEEVGRLVKQYCENTDQDFRNKLRADVNASAAPHTMEVTCN